MRYLQILLALSPTLLFAQAHNWGGQLRLAPHFNNDDSLLVRTGSVRTGFDGSDTLYSDVITTKGDTDEGIFNVAFYGDGLTGDIDSLRLQVRLAVNFKKSTSNIFFGGGPDSTFVRWGPWQTIFPAMNDDQLYHKTISPQDSSWYMPASGRQYRLFDGSVSSGSFDVRHHLTEFSR